MGAKRATPPPADGKPDNWTPSPPAPRPQLRYEGADEPRGHIEPLQTKNAVSEASESSVPAEGGDNTLWYSVDAQIAHDAVSGLLTGIWSTEDILKQREASESHTDRLVVAMLRLQRSSMAETLRKLLAITHTELDPHLIRDCEQVLQTGEQVCR